MQVKDLTVEELKLLIQETVVETLQALLTTLRMFYVQDRTTFSIGFRTLNLSPTS